MLSLDGSDSFDPEDTIIKYQWQRHFDPGKFKRAESENEFQSERYRQVLDQPYRRKWCRNVGFCPLGISIIPKYSISDSFCLVVNSHNENMYFCPIIYIYYKLSVK